jgi:Na+-translocating ferredoxin:NAD+ oxidoreductase RnfD subunit
VFTRRIPLIVSWLGAFVLQAAVRHFLFGNLFLPSLNPMTGVAFLLFTFYMVTDPATTPSSVRGQIAFGMTVAAAYGTLMAFHIVFGLFFGLSITCAARGVLLHAKALAAQRAEARQRLEVRVPAEA